MTSSFEVQRPEELVSEVWWRCAMQTFKRQDIEFVLNSLWSFQPMQLAEKRRDRVKLFSLKTLLHSSFTKLLQQTHSHLRMTLITFVTLIATSFHTIMEVLCLTSIASESASSEWSWHPRGSSVATSSRQTAHAPQSPGT